MMGTIDEQLNNMPLEEGDSSSAGDLFSVEDIEGKSELTAEQVNIMARMKIVGETLEKHKHGTDIVSRFTKHFLTLQLSKDRSSRKEFVSALQSKNDERMGSVMDNFAMNLGGGGK